MKSRILTLCIFLIFVSTGFCSSNKPDGFIFKQAETWGEKLATLLSLNVFDSIKEMRVHYPPSYFEIDQLSEKTEISFMTSSGSGASWYTRELKYDEEIQGYEFLIYNYGGRAQTARILYDEQNDKLELYLKGSGIWGDTEWIYFSELVFPLYNYQP